MSDGYPTAPQKEALRLICEHGPLDADRLGHRLADARRVSGDPGHAAAIARMAGTLAWRPAAQGFIAQAEGAWAATAAGRRVISCTGERA
ncbi:hypothetical protein HS048_20645 [Planomonospora sp. ID91781]|uniref:Uncharacterized protein n=1 Tax=Planomonospora sphaerica TaxID=161355 RepID=A0A171DPR4_9ACTN|nr:MULTISPECIES: hypothetical protein [Planomonospora]MBG0823147.1 hypothetical protein [Planomonospora sp. ID91781]GAT71046.1 hypothetical protein PS9374_06737 [Planomonospora sphaerica]